MLLRFRVANFRSIRDEQELLLAKPQTDKSAPSSQTAPANAVAAIYGANASGKTNLLRAIAFLSSAVVRSHVSWVADEPIPVEPFALEPDFSDISEFEADFVIDGIRHTYGCRMNSR